MTQIVTEERPPERDVDEMEERVDRLENKIDDLRTDWERKREDDAVPGAQPHDDADSAA
jgi:hypothetical protein